jgi:hypothetical protein
MSPTTKAYIKNIPTRVYKNTSRILLEMLSTGKISLMRVLAFFVVGDVMVMWNISCVKHGFVLQSIPQTVVEIVCAVVVGKVWQRYAENKNKEGEES